MPERITHWSSPEVLEFWELKTTYQSERAELQYVHMYMEDLK